jgi:dihydroneopterin aldolase
MTTNLQSNLTVNGIRILVHLGHTKEEQRNLQEIKVDISIKFPQLPMACQTDNLNDTICYATLSEKLLNYVDGKTFNLIEHLTNCFYDLIKQELTNDIKISVKVHKMSPLSFIMQSSFMLSDW